MQNWVLLIVIYAILNGIWAIFKKKALTKNAVMEVLATYSLLAFCLVAFEFPSAIQLDLKYILFILLKSLVIFWSWFLGFYCIKKIPISLYGVLNLSRIIFSTLWGIIFLHESLKSSQLLGGFIIITGLVLVNIQATEEGKKQEAIKLKYIILLLFSFILSTLSGLIDKIIMKDILSGQLQFWFMFFLAVMYWGYLLFARTKVEFKKLVRNYWIALLAICLIIGDRALFIANSIPESRLSTMSLIKQLSALVTIVIGGLVFKEKKLLYRFICSIIVLIGISIVILF